MSGQHCACPGHNRPVGTCLCGCHREFWEAVRAERDRLRAACQVAYDCLDNERVVLGHGEPDPGRPEPYACSCHVCTVVLPTLRAALAVESM